MNLNHQDYSKNSERSQQHSTPLSPYAHVLHDQGVKSVQHIPGSYIGSESVDIQVSPSRDIRPSVIGGQNLAREMLHEPRSSQPDPAHSSHEQKGMNSILDARFSQMEDEQLQRSSQSRFIGARTDGGVANIQGDLASGRLARMRAAGGARAANSIMAAKKYYQQLNPYLRASSKSAIGVSSSNQTVNQALFKQVLNSNPQKMVTRNYNKSAHASKQMPKGSRNVSTLNSTGINPMHSKYNREQWLHQQHFYNQQAANSVNLGGRHGKTVRNMSATRISSANFLGTNGAPRTNVGLAGYVNGPISGYDGTGTNITRLKGIMKQRQQSNMSLDDMQRQSNAHLGETQLTGLRQSGLEKLRDLPSHMDGVYSGENSPDGHGMGLNGGGPEEMGTLFSGRTAPHPLPTQHQKSQRRAVQISTQTGKYPMKSRLKSANIYSQKIKMYNPNMLIFTPN